MPNVLKMPPKQKNLLLIVCLTLAGCAPWIPGKRVSTPKSHPVGGSLWVNGWRTTWIEPHRYKWNRDRYQKRSRHLAKSVWNEVLACNPGVAFSQHYSDGFREGFADYVDLGGDGQPPPVPPRRYWNPKYQNPEGHLAIQQWYDGFRHGAAMAQSSGLRPWTIMPTPHSPGQDGVIFSEEPGGTETFESEVVPSNTPHDFPEVLPTEVMQNPNARPASEIVQHGLNIPFVETQGVENRSSPSMSSGDSSKVNTHSKIPQVRGISKTLPTPQDHQPPALSDQQLEPETDSAVFAPPIIQRAPHHNTLRSKKDLVEQAATPASKLPTPLPPIAPAGPSKAESSEKTPQVREVPKSIPGPLTQQPLHTSNPSKVTPLFILGAPRYESDRIKQDLVEQAATPASKLPATLPSKVPASSSNAASSQRIPLVSEILKESAGAGDQARAPAKEAAEIASLSMQRGPQDGSNRIKQDLVEQIATPASTLPARLDGGPAGRSREDVERAVRRPTEDAAQTRNPKAEPGDAEIGLTERQLPPELTDRRRVVARQLQNRKEGQSDADGLQRDALRPQLPIGRLPVFRDHQNASIPRPLPSVAPTGTVKRLPPSDQLKPVSFEFSENEK